MKKQRGFQTFNKVRTCQSLHCKENIQTGQLIVYHIRSHAFTEATAQGMTNKSSVWHNDIHVPVHWVKSSIMH